MGIQNINLYPDPPTINSNLTVTIKGYSAIDLTDPKILLEVSVMSIPVYHLDIDLCSVNNCPIPKNKPYSLAFKYFIPDDKIHDIDADVKITINDNSKEIACINVQTHLNLLRSPRPSQLNNIMNSLTLHNTIEYLFTHWIRHYGRNYTPEEYTKRLSIFIDNTKYILSHKNSQYTLGHNHLSDLNRVEYRTLLGYKPSAKKNYLKSPSKLHIISNIPESIDWRDKGAVTPVKNQGQCGSCWSFSTTGALEGAYFIKTGKLVSFSEQELVSCDKVDQGCNGGLMDNAFEWIHNNNGLCAEDTYPYESGNGDKLDCSLRRGQPKHRTQSSRHPQVRVRPRRVPRPSPDSKAKKCTPVENSTITSYVDVVKNTKSLSKALSQQPVAIAIEADHLSFQFYKSGVYKADCGTKLDHGVLAVGYDKLNDLDYWIVKNSWSANWGDEGYILIEKGKDTAGGECGILLSASYPLL